MPHATKLCHMQSMSSRLAHGLSHALSAAQARALQPNAEHAQQTARLLGELRALARQRRGEALLGCRLHLVERLGACEQHLGTPPRSAEHACMSETSACIHASVDDVYIRTACFKEILNVW